MAKKWFVIDTSVYLSDSECLTRFGNNDIIVPLKVLEEIDKHKKRQDLVGAQARKIIRIWDELRVSNEKNKSLNCEHLSLLDYAIFPFVRQFRNVDQDWFDKLNFIFLNKWINQIIDSKEYSSIMKKFKKWEPNDLPIYTNFE